MFSKACEYGIRSMVFISMKSAKGERVNITDVANAIDSPNAFTAKVLQKLVKNNVVDSIKGPYGGFHISNETMERVKLSDVVAAIDGDAVYKDCGLGLKECNELKPCPLHDRFKEVRGELKAMLEETTLKDLAEQLEKGTSFLKT